MENLLIFSSWAWFFHSSSATFVSLVFSCLFNPYPLHRHWFLCSWSSVLVLLLLFLSFFALPKHHFFLVVALHLFKNHVCGVMLNRYLCFCVVYKMTSRSWIFDQIEIWSFEFPQKASSCLCVWVMLGADTDEQISYWYLDQWFSISSKPQWTELQNVGDIFG